MASFTSNPNQTPIPDTFAEITSNPAPQFDGAPAVVDDGFQLPAVDGIFTITSQIENSQTLWNVNEPGYNSYDVDQRTEFHGGAIVVPVAGPPGTPPEVIIVHAGYYSKVAAFTLEVQGRKPTLPSPNTGNLNDVLAYSSITAAAPVVGPDGLNQLYRVSGLYAYAIAVPLQPSTPIQTGALPYLTLQTTDTQLLPAEFSQSVLATPGY